MKLPPPSVQRLRRALNGCRSPLGRSAIRRGVLPTLEPQRMLRRLRPDLVVDVGANRGQFALDVLLSCPEASVVSFEPLPSEADVFESILGRLPTVHLIRAAAGDRDGTALLHVTRAADSSSLLVPTVLQAEVFPGTETTHAASVRVVRLDDVAWPVPLTPRSMLKLDVQGAELDVLRGAGELLDRFRWIYVEVSFLPLYTGQPQATDIIRFLDAHGFELRDLSTPVVRDGRTVQVDLLLARGTAS